MTFSVATRNLTMHKGADWSESFSIELDDTPIDLTGYLFEGQARREENSDPPLAFEFTFTHSVDNLSITVSVPWETIEEVDTGPKPDSGESQLWYDFFVIEPSGNRTKFQTGCVTIYRSITESPETP
ncbi:hypothetical protein VN12_04210 [Pirellula sp. SH-Sr6A]|uniref:hypothetical protein n=1 Tax=Pirellula sp. SH-Sr6A TaxID=1632865 RepID=UPI00078B5D18|nr:hypothetical protein [Pirellula sp. SH-Sr6A]AMV31296.1 hypothetical protein VN12_04210 [Pirellula sp. SH-Sr6A]